MVLTKKDLHVERITPDSTFMEEKLLKVKHFFKVAVLPELIGRWFSRPPPECASSTMLHVDLSAQNTSSATYIDATSISCPSSDAGSELFCYCQQGDNGKMVGCDNENCKYKWFHLECLKLKSFPRTAKWYCPDCRKHCKKKK